MAPRCGQPSQPRCLLHLYRRFGGFAETKELALASQQRGGLREAWEEGGGEHYRYSSISIKSVSGKTRHGSTRSYIFEGHLATYCEMFRRIRRRRSPR